MGLFKGFAYHRSQAGFVLLGSLLFLGIPALCFSDMGNIIVLDCTLSTAASDLIADWMQFHGWMAAQKSTE